MITRPVINKFHTKNEDVISRSENTLCECDRPDQSDNPHRHTLDVACVYWVAGRPSVEARMDALLQLNVDPVD